MTKAWVDSCKYVVLFDEWATRQANVAMQHGLPWMCCRQKRRQKSVIVIVGQMVVGVVHRRLAIVIVLILRWVSAMVSPPQ